MEIDEVRNIARDARRVVVKIGSRSLMGNDPNVGRFAQLAGQIARANGDDRSVILVSSGAVLFGWRRLGLPRRPKTAGKLQASAAVGQSRLMKAYEDAFRPYGLVAAEVLLTHDNLADRESYLHARSAIDALLELGAVPIINENGTVSFDELVGFGDNDQLAAMVATLVGADLLVLLSDVEGLLDRDGKRVARMRDFEEARALVRPKESADSLGGMESKLDAAERATHLGVPVVMADARQDEILDQVLRAEDVGTWFLPHHQGIGSRKHWIAFTLKPQGTVQIDAGAVRALVRGKHSLLPAGVTGVSGNFDAGDAVSILGPDGVEVARGLSRYGLVEVAQLAGAQSDEIKNLAVEHRGDAIVHRDDMVVY